MPETPAARRWSAIIHAVETSGPSQRELAGRRRVNPSTLAWWPWRPGRTTSSEAVDLWIPFGSSLFRYILEAAGVRIPARKRGRSPDGEALRGCFTTFFPGLQWVGDGTPLSVEVDGITDTLSLGELRARQPRRGAGHRLQCGCGGEEARLSAARRRRRAAGQAKGEGAGGSSLCGPAEDAAGRACGPRKDEAPVGPWSTVGPVPSELVLRRIAGLPPVAVQRARYAAACVPSAPTSGGAYRRDDPVAKPAPRHDDFRHALDRARRYQGWLDDGTHPSLASIGRAEGISGTPVGQLLALLHLAPEIVAVLERPREDLPRGLTRRAVRDIARLRDQDARRAACDARWPGVLRRAEMMESK